MRPEIRLWSIDAGKLVQLAKTNFAEAHKEKDLEIWVEQSPSLLGRNLSVVGRQVYIPKVGPLDLLAVDDDGRLVIVEFKRQQSTRDTIAQILDYASAIRLMTVEQLKALPNVIASEIEDDAELIQE
jgi:RecB family endonuclease NucS